ncbi:MAG TPA: hypothetical protein VGH02_09865 [Rhizomicrobium sp.]|jgi:hypothetical protein
MAKKKSRKAKKAAKRPAAKAKKSKKAKKAKKAVVRKASKRTAAKKAKRPAAKATKRPAKKARKTGDVTGEGNYTASREFRKDEEAFVRANRGRIAEMGKNAERALEGPEGDELRKAEDEARAHARD